MSESLIYLDPDSPLSLQSQIRQRLVEGILLGTFPAGSRLPSSRKLAENLGVARNTVVLAYQQLVDEGYLESRERSGIFVQDTITEGRVGFRGRLETPQHLPKRWGERLRPATVADSEFRWPEDWSLHPYPFIDGCFDASLYPTAQWREASRMAMGSRVVTDSAVTDGDADDPELLEQIRTKVLPRRGINARPEEILVTFGEQNALYLVTEVLAGDGLNAIIEEPGNPRMRQLLKEAGCRTWLQPVDGDGMVIDERLAHGELVYVTPSHQVPTAVTLTTERRQALLEAAERHDLMIVEDDFQSESNYLGRPHPALRGMDEHNRVVYVSGLPKVLAPGVRIGFIVAAEELIREARRRRRLMMGRPSLINQRTAALFLGLGHYDAFMSRTHQVFQRRWNALRDALNHYFRQAVVTLPSRGGTAFWVEGPQHLDASFLVHEAARRGILIEPTGHYYGAPEHTERCFRLGVTSIPEDRIRDGVAELAGLIRELNEGAVEYLDEGSPKTLDAESLARRLPGATLMCQTVYGEPCTIELHADGRMTGRAGHANEERDTGRWWLEGDLWCRRWKSWSYAEVAAFRVVVEGRRIGFYNPQGRLIEQALIRFGDED